MLPKFRGIDDRQFGPCKFSWAYVLQIGYAYAATYGMWFRLPVPNPNPKPNPRNHPNPNPIFNRNRNSFWKKNDTEI